MKRQSSLTFIFITILIDVLGIGLLIPILPEFIAHLTQQSLSEASRNYGVLLSIYGAMQFLFSPLLGTLSDQLGRRPVLLLSLFFAGVDYVLMALAPNLIWLYIGRTLSGITGASFTVANAYIADVSPPEKRSQNFGIIGAAFGLGFIIGPAAGGFLGQWGPRIPFWAAAALCFGNLLYGWLILPESLPVENRRHFSWRAANPMGALQILRKYPVVWGLTGALTLSNLAMNCVNSTWVLFTAIRFGWGARETGFSLAAFGAVALVYQLYLARRLIPLWGERRTMLIGLGVAATEFTAYGLSTQGWMIYALTFAGGVGLLGGQATQGLLSQQVGENEQGALQGALSSLASLTGIVAPLIATRLFAHFTAVNMPFKIPGIAFFLASLFDFLALAIAIRVLSRMRTPQMAVAETK
ncbi:MFS transporter, DHA1 family, tetracycline resistance protein [Abditibacterium utsteinense]|uniref:MFS transporter, DHA1 family, tetracycline resistance protein n=1 Tax=Abditibacterium utsteinense TaxID=1960156 RepID=A0A2S8SRS7_9BACT|nr:TCR/Tet family MFS transporter [Abditibacterium utsteinense]PQV63500.1 MFS transporter, DHA1 family, tetracycline resistance protein [Abditibacterium utsteinense]